MTIEKVIRTGMHIGRIGESISIPVTLISTDNVGETNYKAK